MSQSPLQAEGSKSYAEAWRAINILTRSDGSWSGRERNLCFRNRGDGTFEDVSFTSGLDLPADGRAFVPLDLDGDGDLDLILKNRNGRQLRAFRNDMRAGRTRRLAVRLQGRRSNRDGVGGRVWLDTDKRTLMREIASGSGYLSQRSREATFAVPEEETVRSVRVRWPLGTAQVLEDPPQEGTVSLVEGEESFSVAARAGTSLAASEPAGASTARTEPGTWLAEPVPAPDFSLREVRGDGRTVRLSAMRGGPVLLNFWATWCPPCRAELSAIQARYGDLASQGAAVLAVSLDDPGGVEAVGQMASELGLEFPVLLADAQTAEAYSVLNERLFDRRRALAVPTTFLLDGRGRILKAYRGEVDAEVLLRDVRAGRGEALPFAGRWAASRPTRDFEELAAAFAERGLGAPALAMFDEALARGERSPRLLNNLAGALLAEGRSDRAEALLREALAAQPALADAQVNLGALLAERGTADEAERLLQAALAAQPEDSQALSVLGSVRFSQGRLQDAETLFRRAARSEPEDARFRENLGAALAAQGRFGEALEQYEAARRLGADSGAVHTNLAVLYMQTGQADRAGASFARAAASDPDDPGAHLNLARYHLQAGALQQALASVRRAIDLAPREPAARLLEARTLAALGRSDEARSAAREAVRLDPESDEAAGILESLR